MKFVETTLASSTYKLYKCACKILDEIVDNPGPGNQNLHFLKKYLFFNDQSQVYTRVQTIKPKQGNI